MKEDLYKYIEEHKDEIFELGETLFNNPELGFKEVETGRIIKDYLTNHNLKAKKETALTGFTVEIGSGKPHIGIIAELDAIPTQGHPCANPETTAAHACGHSTQQTMALAAFTALKQQIDSLKGTVTLFFTPAEEFTDLEYRKQLQAEGKIKYLSGKENMIYEHMFDDVDCIIHFHAKGNNEYRYSINSTLAGFIYKKITFVGKSAHAAVLPHLGVNALNECTLFLDAINMLRETFRDEDMVRVHGIITDGGNTVNSIPDKVVYECYVRTTNPEILHSLNDQLTKAAQGCASALGGSVIVEDTPGYLPLIQSKELNEVVLENILNFAKESEIQNGEKSVAAGDVGDIGAMKPLIQYGYSGFSGRIHGTDLEIKDPYEIYITQAKIIAGTVYDLLTNPEKVKYIVDSFKPSITYDEYIKYLDNQ